METLKIENDKKNVFTPNKLDSRKLKGVRKFIHYLAKNEVEAITKHHKDDAELEPLYHHYNFLKKYIHVKEGDCYYYYDPDAKIQPLYSHNKIFLVKVKRVEFDLGDDSLNITIENPRLKGGNEVYFNYENQLDIDSHELLLNEADMIEWIDNVALDFKFNELPF